MLFLKEKLFFSYRIASLLLFIILILGWTAVHDINLEQFPHLEIPVAVVEISWPGTRAEIVEQKILLELEKNIQSLPFITRMISSASDQRAIVYLDLDPDQAMTTMMYRLREQVSSAELSFPQNVGIEPASITHTSTSGLTQMKFLLMGADALELTKAARSLQDQLHKLPEVGSIQAYGMTPEEVSIEPDYQALDALGISLNSLMSTLKDAAQSGTWSPAPTMKTTDKKSHYYRGYFGHEKQLYDIPVTGEQGVVPLGEIAKIRTKAITHLGFMRCSNHNERSIPCIMLELSFTQGSNITNASKKIQSKLEAHISSIKKEEKYSNLQSQLISNTSTQLNYNLSQLSQAISQTIIILMVILLSMLSWRSGLIAAAGILLSILGTIVVLYLLGHTLNTISIAALIVSMGIVADIFILVLEGMHDALRKRHMPSRQAVEYTLNNYFIPSLAGQATTLLALLPLFFMSGIDGRLLGEIPFTLSVIIVVSYFVAFLVVLPLSRYILSVSASSYVIADPYIELWKIKLKNFLINGPISSRRSAYRFCLVFSLVILFGFGAATQVPLSAAVDADDTAVDIGITLTHPLELEELNKLTYQIESLLIEQTAIERFQLYTSSLSPESRSDPVAMVSERNNSSQFSVSIQLVARDQRTMTSRAFVSELREQLKVRLSNWPSAQVRFFHKGGRFDLEAPVQIILVGSDWEGMSEVSSSLEKQLTEIPGIYDITSSTGRKLQDIVYQPRSRVQANNNISSGFLALEVQNRMGNSIPVGSIHKEKESRDVVIRSSKDYIPSELRIELNGQTESLEWYVDKEYHERFQLLTHFDRHRGIQISANSDNNTQITGQVEKLVDSMKKHLPEGYQLFLKGDTESVERNHSDATMALMISLALIYLVLALTLENFIYPLFIMIIIPLALAITIIFFLMIKLPISLYALSGFIVLSGIVVNDGVIIMSTITKEKDHNFKNAIANGVIRRLGPVLSTSLTTVLGLLPLAMVDDRWLNLSITLIIGLTSGTFIILIILPILVYLVAERKA